MGTTLYHITPSPDDLLVYGADSSRVGAGAGIQAGRGFYLAREEDIEFWGARVSGWTLAVSLPENARLLARNALDQDAFNAWCVEQGFVTLEDGRFTFLPAMESATGISMDDARRDPIAAWTMESILVGLYAESFGYDGVDYDDQIVITNYDLLPSVAFSRA